jgi:hypothetical protein
MHPWDCHLLKREREFNYVNLAYHLTPVEYLGMSESLQHLELYQYSN